MKAHYDKSDRDYYILFENNEIEKVLVGEIITCEMYVCRNSEIEFSKRKLHVTSVLGMLELYKKNNLSKYILKDYQDPILLEHGDFDGNIPYILTLTASWMQEGLSKELLKRCGHNEQRYGGGCKIHFYADEGNSLMHMYTTGFDIVEARWKGMYGNNETLQK